MPQSFDYGPVRPASLVIAIVRWSSRVAAGFRLVQRMAALNKCLARSNKSCTGPKRLTSADEIRDGWKMTYITSEDLADLDDTIEDEMEVEEFAMAAAREASAMLLELLSHTTGTRRRVLSVRRFRPAGGGL